MEPTLLPEEIFTMICTELGRKGDFDTLYHCAQSSKAVADAALRTIYQFHEESAAFGFTEDDLRDKDEYFRKWMLLWRSIIASSVEPCPTFKPYCRYLRILDFRNLSAMLESNRFRSNKRSFFARPLGKLAHMRKVGKFEVADDVAIINDIGDMVIPKATLLEEISGHMRPGYLARWVAQTPRLKRMVLWEGEALDDGAGKAMAEHCEYFDALDVFIQADPIRGDDIVATFLRDLRPDTLRYLQFIGHNHIERRSFEALGRHGNLKELSLSALSPKAMENLDGLKACVALEVLSLEDFTGSTRLEEFNNDVFAEVIVWLSSCTKLRDITLKKFVDGPSILAAVAVAPGVKWTRLCLVGYTVRNASAASFHTALADQRGLESLFLSGNGEDTHPHDLEIMVSSICQLPQLKELVLKQVSDEFDMTHITNLALNLPLLEEFWTSGEELDADILPLLANMRRLRNLTLFALTQFDLPEILDFINRLDPQQQKGFSLSLMAVHQDFALSDEEIKLVSDAMREHVEGRFDHVPWRDAPSDDSDDD